MMYSRGTVDDGRGTDIGHLEGRLAELEKLVEELESVSGAEVVGVLDRAVALLAEVNAGIEAGLAKAEGEAQELGDLLEEVDFGPFDEALDRLQRPSDDPGGG